MTSKASFDENYAITELRISLNLGLNLGLTY